MPTRGSCCATPCARARTRRSFFFFQAEDGIRDLIVTGVQTCALPIFDWSQLNVDASTLPAPEAKGRPASKAAANSGASWSSNQKANGASDVSVKQSIDRKSVV